MTFMTPFAASRSRCLTTTYAIRCSFGAWPISPGDRAPLPRASRPRRTLPEGDRADTEGFYQCGDFPDTAMRMRRFEQHAPALAQAAVDRLQLGAQCDRITHLLITCCTGFSAPGLDLELIERCRLPSTVERTTIGFMGCYAAINALKLAHHIVRSEASARVFIVNLELCTLHLQDTTDLEQMLSFLLFGDGCAACIVSADPVGVALDSFHAVLVPSTRGLITWNIRETGFDWLWCCREGPCRRSMMKLTGTWKRNSSRGAPSLRSIFGRFIPAVATCSTRSSALSTRPRRRWRRRGMSCVAMATCRLQPSCL